MASETAIRRLPAFNASKHAEMHSFWYFRKSGGVEGVCKWRRNTPGGRKWRILRNNCIVLDEIEFHAGPESYEYLEMLTKTDEVV